jgi:hypothetical protein
VTVTNGIVSLHVTALTHRPDSLFVRIFDGIAHALKSPIVSAASRGFGIPALAVDALTFVDDVLHRISLESTLVPLWQTGTGSLEFGVTKEARTYFKMTPGLWAVVDADYARSTNNLHGHTVDLEYQSFRINDRDGKAVDATYLVADLKFSS